MVLESSIRTGPFWPSNLAEDNLQRGRAATAAAAATVTMMESGSAFALLHSGLRDAANILVSPTSYSRTPHLPSSHSLAQHQHFFHGQHSLQLAAGGDFSQVHSPLSLSMAAFQAPDDELARFQELSNKWEPETTGPLVSERLSSSAITTEYANADPAFQVKTETLPQKYAQYRTCRGDGHCGWRAVAFSYYETLQRIDNQHLFLEEETRLKSLHNLLKDVGFQEHLFEDFADDAFELLRETSAATDGGAGLLRAFNDVNRSLSIITYLKLLTSAWIQKHPEDYEPFVNEPVRQYCANHIEPAVCEIEHVGMSALVDVLAKPAGMAVEILYLDRSPGDEVTTYSFYPLDQSGTPLPNPPTFRLLYRPGHYDILYKLEDLPTQRRPDQPPVTQQNVFVALNHAQTHPPHLHAKLPFEVNDLEIPGMSFFPNHAHAWSTYPHYEFQQAAVGPTMEHPRALPTPVGGFPPLSPTNIQEEFYPSSLSMESPSTATSAVPQSQPLPVTIQNVMPFRRSRYEYENNFASASSQTPLCQTSIFKNSHFNTAHFNNPDFEPEQWQPDAEYAQNDRPRKKSSSN